MVIYCDMDGVLSDYVTQFVKLFNDQPENVFSLLGEKETNQYINNYDHFWLEMPLMKDGKVLWSFLKSYDPVLLTTPAESVETCKDDKIAWKNKYLGEKVLIIFSDSKEDYASPEAILIDDKKENIDKFINAGGIGILHTSAEETIKQLVPILNKFTNLDKIVARTKYFTIKQTPAGEEFNDNARKSAVCLPVKVEHNEVYILVRKEANSIRGQFYTLVGGGIEENESLEKGILRELQEEAGIIASEEHLHYAGLICGQKYTKEKVPLFFVLLDKNCSQETPSTDGTINEKISFNSWISFNELSSFTLNVEDSFLLSAICKFLLIYNEKSSI